MIANETILKTLSPLRQKLAMLRGLVAAISKASPLEKVRAATDALAVADQLFTEIVDRIEKLEAKK